MERYNKEVNVILVEWKYHANYDGVSNLWGNLN